MNLIIRTFTLLSILYCCGIVARPQSIEIPQNKYANDPCGDPMAESSTWTSVEGKVVKVIDGDRIIMSIDNKKRLLVHLVGIDAPALNQPYGRDAQQFLERLMGGKRVEVLVSPVLGYSNAHDLKRLLVLCIFEMEKCRMLISL